MKNILIFILLFLTIAISANTYYVAPPIATPHGDDAHAGTITAPWATWQKAFDMAEAGDTVFFRGGVYYSSGISTEPNLSPYSDPVHGHSGTRANPICFWAYPPDFEAGSYPILDCRDQLSYSSLVTGFSVTSAQYIHFKGLTVRNVYQRTGPDKLGIGIALNQCANVTFENMTIHNISGRGIWGASVTGYIDPIETPITILCDTTRWINCDLYDLRDSLSSNPGNAADGFKCTLNGRSSVSYPLPYWYLYGCRVWNYSDDGFDIGGVGQIIYDHCWASSTTKYASMDLEGDGFKSGGLFLPMVLADTALPIYWRVWKNCLAFDCVGFGFGHGYESDFQGYALWVNNTAYNCFTGYAATSYWNIHHVVLYNNIAYDNTSGDYEQTQIYRPSVYTESNNTWIATQDPNGWPGWEYNDNVTVTDADFLSMDHSAVFGTRQADWSLPDIDFLKLVSTSDLVNAGISNTDYTNAGLTYYGSAPDVGYSEYSSGIIPPVNQGRIVKHQGGIVKYNGKIIKW